MSDDSSRENDRRRRSAQATPGAADSAPAASDSTTSPEAARTAQIRTAHSETATVAAAVRPDNTDSMRTTVANGCVTTRIERDTTGGLQSSVDDYVVNLTVAETVIDVADTLVTGHQDTTPVGREDREQNDEQRINDEHEHENEHKHKHKHNS